MKKILWLHNDPIEAETTGAEPTVSPTSAESRTEKWLREAPRGQRGRGLVESKDGGAFGLFEGPGKRRH